MKNVLFLGGFILCSFLSANSNPGEKVPGHKSACKKTGREKGEPDSLDIKIGQLIIFGFYGTAVSKNDPVYKAVQEGKVGSILIYGRNIAARNSADSLQRLIRSFQKAAAIPLFISIDQEGGLVNRLPRHLGFPLMPSAYYLGRKNDVDTTKYYSDNIAFTLSRLGINLNYAPVLDLHNDSCPVMGARERCFSADPDEVTKQAGVVIRSHHYFGVHTVLKHFPGHGSSLRDSHFGVADVTKTWQPQELIPYQTLIENNLVDGIMTAHIVNAKLDPSRVPATLSRTILTGLLRDSLGFRGVIFSDDMLMEAISSHYGLRESIRKAIDAGVDILMFSNNIRGVSDYTPSNIHRIIKELVISGKISTNRIDESYRRVMQMKQKRVWGGG
ncbi:MAG: glycoside hydrolase family 3 protein [Bacteroidetes bacterium]|nr:glycoside hydrolase family 3 protein [Bacteroidota bacterium]